MKKCSQTFIFFLLWISNVQAENNKVCGINTTNIPIITDDKFIKMINFLEEMGISWDVNNAAFGSKFIWEAFRQLVSRGFEKTPYESQMEELRKIIESKSVDKEMVKVWLKNHTPIKEILLLSDFKNYALNAPENSSLPFSIKNYPIWYLNNFILDAIYLTASANSIHSVADPHDTIFHFPSLLDSEFMEVYDNYSKLLLSLLKSVDYKPDINRLILWSKLPEGGPPRDWPNGLVIDEKSVPQLSVKQIKIEQLYDFLITKVRMTTHENFSYVYPKTGKLILQGNAPLNALQVIYGRFSTDLEFDNLTAIRSIFFLSGIDIRSSNLANDLLSNLRKLDGLEEFILATQQNAQLFKDFEQSIIKLKLDSIGQEKLKIFFQEAYKVAFKNTKEFNISGFQQNPDFKEAQHVIIFVLELEALINRNADALAFFNRDNRLNFFRSAVQFSKAYVQWLH